MTNLGNVTAVLGSQWGDEGKGKLIDILSEKFQIIARAAGGANAGHTIYITDPNLPHKKTKYVFHLVPSGMLNEHTICVIGNGVALHLETLFKELELLEESEISTKGRILISDRAHLLFEYHKIIDGLQEEMKGDKKVGTTKRGIGPCYTDKVRRNGIRVHELMDFKKFQEKYMQNLEMLKKMYGFEYDPNEELEIHRKFADKLQGLVIDSAHYLNEAAKNGQNILIEGANGALLDIDHGTYPFVTSSNSSIGGILSGTGIGPLKFRNIIGTMKAYTTRVGAGPFPTELLDDLGEQIRESGGEYGATTGRPRRCGWFDAVVGKYSVMINGLTEVNLTKLDVLTGIPILKIAIGYKTPGSDSPMPSFPSNLELLENVEIEYIDLPGWDEDISAVRSFNDLPLNARNYIQTIEKLIECPVTSIGVGVEREAMIFI